jgi:hypothetical protein
MLDEITGTYKWDKYKRIYYQQVLMASVLSNLTTVMQVCVGTGSGKSIIISTLAMYFLHYHEKKKVYILTLPNLVEQMRKDHGLLNSTLAYDHTRLTITSVDTIFSIEAPEKGSIILIDEADHVMNCYSYYFRDAKTVFSLNSLGALHMFLFSATFTPNLNRAYFEIFHKEIDQKVTF